MKKYLITALFIALLPLSVYAWTDGSGSLTPSTTTTGVRDVRDILNAVFDETNGMLKTTASTPTFATEVTQSVHDELNGNMNNQQGDADVGTDNRLYTQFSTTTAKNEPMQADHDELNANANMQMNDVDVSSNNEVYVRGAGIAGTADERVITIQGVASMTPVQVGDNSASLTTDFSTTTAKAEVTQGQHDELNVNANSQQNNTDIGTGNRMYVQCSSPSASVEVTQMNHDENNSNATIQQEDSDVNTSNPLQVTMSTNAASQTVDFSSPTANVEVFQMTHDMHNVNANAQQENADVSASNPFHVQGTSTNVKVEMYHGTALPSGNNNIGDVDVVSQTASSSTNKTATYLQNSIPAGTNNIGDVDIASVASSSETSDTTAYQPTGGSYTVDTSSPNFPVTIYHGESLPTGSNTIGEVTASSPTADVTAYQGETFDTNPYADYTSTGTFGRLTVNGTIPDTAFSITNPAFIVYGGTATVTGFLGGTIYLEEGIPWNPGQLQASVDSPTIVVAVEQGVTIKFDYSLVGKQ